MKYTIRFIIVLFSLVVAGTTSVWGITQDDIIVNVLPNSSAGTVSVTVSGMNVTITATPATDYFIDASHIIAEKMVDPSVSHHAPGLSSSLPISGSNPFTFTIPDGYTGAYVTVNFYKKAEGFIQITSLSEITDMNRKYQLTADVSGVSSSLGEFKGTLDGGLHKIIGSSAPLFASTDGAIIRNIIFEDVNISSGDGDGDAGAVTSKAKGATRIYNCGILPTSVERDNKGEITGFYGSSVGGIGNVGGLVGTLSGNARVINCYSYATISNGANKGGIVGSNEETSTQASLTTMVMNCLFYGEIANGGNVSPIYGGTEINNVEGGLNNYNYYRYHSSYSTNKQINKYNRALPMEEKFITRFERYRLLMNSNKKLAAKYASTETVTVEPNDMAKWVLETADRQIANPMPYPVLRKREYNKKYPSIINYDADHAPDSTTVGRLNGGKVSANDGKLTVTILKKSDKTDGGQSWPTSEASDVQTTSLTLIRTDKDTTRFNFNYDKVQLPYYNDVGTGNYTENRVVTGWKITSITGGTAGTFNEADEWGGYNFADRNCTNKDLYSVSKRVFSQGAYWDVPKGVTAITIEPYWGKAAYVSDTKYDVIYDAGYTAKDFILFGNQCTNGQDVDLHGDGNKQKVYTSIGNARTALSIESGKTVYDYAVVLIGNVHQNANPTSNNTPYTVMSIDLNHDNEPDYSYIFGHSGRQPISPIRYDFLNMMGIAEAQIPNGASLLRNVSIFNPLGWFEITNTCVVNFSQFEYDNSIKNAKSEAPLILLGGSFEQFVSTQSSTLSKKTLYIHVGSNAWFAKFGNGTHSDGDKFTPHIPISVTGGDYDEFYLSGTYQPNITNMQSDNAECYISGGRFGEVAGASLEAIWGDVRWDINWADITNFYGGGVNAINPITGDIRIDMTNSYVNRYCGGPKFGDMTDEKTVTTNATGCVFGTYFGAGYGGNAYNRVKYRDEKDAKPSDYQSLYTNDRGKYFDGITTNAYNTKPAYGRKGKGVATDFDSEFFIWSSGETGARFFVKFITFSLATTHGVTSNLTKCKVTGNVYGGGSLGKVEGNVSTKLKDCEVSGNVFGAGFSATIPKVEVRKTPAFIAGKEPTKNMNIGMFESGEINTTEEYEWKQVATSDLSNGGTGMVTQDGKNYVYTDTNLSALGIVTGDATLEIQGTTTVGGSVYGGGEESAVNGDTQVTINGGSVNQSVYGGGCEADVKGNTTVTMTDGYIFNGIYGGGLSGSVGTFERSTDPTDVNIFGHTAHEGCIGKPKSCAQDTGKCTIVVSGGQIGPIEVATLGMNRPASQGGPVPEGWVWGGGRGKVESPNENPDVHFTAYVGSTDVTIKENAFILESIIGGGEFGRVLGNTKVNIKGGQIGVGANQTEDGKPKRYPNEKFVDPNVTPITNENALAPCSHYPYGKVVGGKTIYETYDPYADEYKANHSESLPTGLEGGSTDNASDGKTWIGCVFGGGSGYFPYKDTDANGQITKYGWVESAGWVEGNTEVFISGGHILSNVYGANEYTNVKGKSTVTMTGGTIGVPLTEEQFKNCPQMGHLFGGGKGDPRTYFNKRTNVESVEINISGGIIYGSVYGGGEDGHVISDVTTTISQASGKTTTIGCGGLSGNDGNVFGGGKGSPTALTAGVIAGNVNLNITGGTIWGSAYGGGQIASVGTSFETPTSPNYGKMQEGNEHGNLTVSLTGGTIHQNVYGGCMGTNADADHGVTEEFAAKLGISKNVTVELNKDVDDAAKGCVVLGNIFGCNNVNSSPEGTSTVHIYKTQRNGASRINNTNEVTNAKVIGTKDANGEFVLNSFDVQAVYGGGNLAAYTPKDENGSTNVIIDGCDRTSIGQVYGGGNAASTPATNVLVNGTFEIGELFGGGNGKDAIVVNNVSTPNPGANVGYKDYHLVEDDPAYASKEVRTEGDAFATYRYGTGLATVNIKGGTIHRVFGGSNTKGNVRRTALTMLEELQNNGEPVCRFQVDEAYGGGKSAPMDAEAKLHMACIPGLQEAYGGAEAADIHDDVTLTITNGTFNRVFGGNNISGTISGKITVNVEETGCRPVVIGELYGGGNLAAYSKYGYNDDGTPKESGENPSDDPVVNVRSFTSIGAVYGGGYGTGAKMIASPTVNINESVGSPDTYPTTGDYDENGFKGKTITLDKGKETEHKVTLPAHTKGKMGAIGDVFGGGNAAEVKGNTKVNIGTLSENTFVSVDDDPATTETDESKKPVLGADIRGNVYGGGNNAEVTGNTNVVIGKKNENQ